MDLKPIETVYNGYRFRSRLEARWAVFFDTLGVKYEYEKEGYELNGYYCRDHWAEQLTGERYLPDFWLPSVSLRDGAPDGLWLEVKGEYPDDRDTIIYGIVAEQQGHPLVMAVGNPGDYSFPDRIMYELSPAWDEPMLWVKCYVCGHIKIEFAEGSYMECPRCGKRADDNHPDIWRAYDAAKQARFEHGENGAPKPHAKGHRAVIPMAIPELNRAICHTCKQNVLVTHFGITLNMDKTPHPHSAEIPLTR